MNDYQRSKSNMFDVVRKICQKNIVTLSAYIPFNPVFSEFENLCDELLEWLMKQADIPTGITITKTKRRKAIEADGFLLSSILTVYSKVNGLKELGSRVRYTITSFKMADGQKLTGMCHQLISDANEHIAGLEPYLIDAAWLTAFEGKIDAFVSITSAPAHARSNIKEATQEVNRLVIEINDLLRYKLDPLMTYFSYQDSLLYANYRNGRKTIAVGREKAALFGTVKDAAGNAVKGLKVRIVLTKRKSITTAKGNFKFKRLKDGNYTLLVFKDTKELARQTVMVPVEEGVEIIVGSKQ